MAKEFHRHYPNLEKRLAVEEKLCQRQKLKGGGFENLRLLHNSLKLGLKISRLDKRGLQNLLKIRTIERDVYLPRLPKAFDGLRILHLSDIHLDGIAGLTEKVCEEIGKLDYDIAVITGDFRYGKREFYPYEIAPTLTLLEHLKPTFGTWAVLGNHDCIEIAEELEKHGAKVLLNENEIIEKEGQRLALVGLDDPHLYRCDDLALALNNINSNLCKILLVHTPEVVEEAAQKGIDFYLCGHTHGGQIALPFGVPLYVNARCRRSFANGEFSHRGMLGYTHRGTGASSVPVRFNCPPEIVVHTLKQVDFGPPANAIAIKPIKKHSSLLPSHLQADALTRHSKEI